MSSTLVGVFVSADDAREASRRLGAAGIAASAICSSQGAWAGHACIDAEREAGMVGRFFLDLFGVRRASLAHVTPAARRGCLVLTVDIAEAHRVEEIGAILEHCGAVDVEERVEAERAGGGRRDYVRRTEFDGLAPYAVPRVRLDPGVERRTSGRAYRGLERRARA